MLEVAHHNCIQSCLNKSQQIVNPVSLTINLTYRLTPTTRSIKILFRGKRQILEWMRRELTLPIFFYDHHNGIEENYLYYCADPVV